MRRIDSGQQMQKTMLVSSRSSLDTSTEWMPQDGLSMWKDCHHMIMTMDTRTMQTQITRTITRNLEMTARKEMLQMKT